MNPLGFFEMILLIISTAIYEGEKTTIKKEKKGKNR